MITIDTHDVDDNKLMIFNNPALPLIYGDQLIAFLNQHNIPTLPFNDEYVEYRNKNDTYDRIYIHGTTYKVQRMDEDTKLNESTLIISHDDYVSLADWIRRDRIH